MTASSPQPGQRAVVTGGAGFLGSHLTASMLFTLINRDITDGLDISGPAEYVFHLASPAAQPESY
jgi:nucleoside-diphosphate-sugar epimerase